MKLLHVITGLGDGGAEAVLYRLITHDSQTTHAVVSLTQEGKYGPLLRQLGVEVVALGMPRGRLTLKGLRLLWQTVRRMRPDVIQTWMYHADLLGGVIGRLVGVPVVWGLRNTTLEPGRSSRGTIWVARVCAWLSRWAPVRIVACAQAAVEVHAALGYDRSRFVVIPNGYHLERFRPDAEARARLRREWAVPDDVPLLGMVARFDPYKDHSNLLAALQQLRQQGQTFRVVLVGTGVDGSNAELVQLIREAGLEEAVRLLGPRPDIAAVMNALDVHVLSSSAEAFPNVLAEAMACGTPCVTTNVGDAAQIVGDAGWVAHPRDTNALAKAIGQALKAWHEPVTWQERQRQCRTRIEQRFSLDTMVRRYHQVWQEAQSCAA